MKDFVKMVLAVLCGFFIIWILGFFFMMTMVGSIALSGGGKTVLPRSGVLSMDLSTFTLGEQTVDTPKGFASLAGGKVIPTIGLWDAVQAVKAAAADPAVKYIYLKPDGFSGGVAQLQEFRKALSDFRESGKAVVAYTENPGNASYYLASASDKIYMTSHHGGTSQLIGLSGRMMFLKDLLDKLGVNYQLIRHGKYKSAGEMYIKNAPSEENLEQNQVMISSIWNALTKDICESRDFDEATFNGLIDDLKLNLPEDFLENKLVDDLVSHDELVSRLCDLAVVDNEEDLHLIAFPDYVAAKVTPALKGNVAIIFADGQIIDGEEYEQVAGDRFARIIDKVRKDDSIKSVVLRVNSPGGSVAASSKIRAALDSLAAVKPLVASYGDYAASGGYWISSGCSKIFSDAATLTGSIGVFSMIPEFSAAAKNIAHVNVVSVGSNKHSDMFSLMRPFDKEEIAYMQASVEDIYSSFVSLVSEGRGMSEEAVDEIAQGRVWAGSDALRIGLVDEIGTLQDAVNYAASEAGLISESDYTVVAYPKPMTVAEQLMEAFGQGSKEPNVLSGTPFEGIGKVLSDIKKNNRGTVLAAMPYDIEIR